MIKRILVLTLFITITGFPDVSATEWDSATFTLSLENPSVSKGDYTINVVEFDGYGMVGINISCNGLFIGNTVLANNDSNWNYLDNGRIRLKCINVTDQRIFPMYGSVYSPRAEIVFSTGKSSKYPASLDISISTDRDEYLIDQVVIVTVLIRNIGEVKIDDIHLDVETDGLTVQKSLPSTFGLYEGTYRSEEITLRFPATLRKGFYNISVNTIWIDAYGRRNFLTESKTVRITQPIKIYKNTPNEALPGQTVYTSISMENIQSRDVQVRLDDAMPIFFTLINGTITDNEPDLSWEFVLAPRERRVFSYQMIPEQVGAHRVPRAHVTWNLWGEEYTNGSDSDNIIAVYQGVSFLERNFPEGITTFDEITFFTKDEETSPEIAMSATIQSTISIEITPDNLDFGKLAPGDISKSSAILIKNKGTNSILVTASVAEEEDLYRQGLDIEGISYKSFYVTIDKNMSKTQFVALKVPETYEGVGSKTGTLMFWAEGVN